MNESARAAAKEAAWKPIRMDSGDSMPDEDSLVVEVEQLLRRPPENHDFASLPTRVKERVLARIAEGGNAKPFADAARELRADQALLVKLIQSLPHGRQFDFRKELSITVPSIGRVDRGRLPDAERREIAGFLMRAERLSRCVELRLLTRIAEARAEGDVQGTADLEADLAAERARRANERSLLSGTPVGCLAIGIGANGARAMRIDGRTLPCVYKSKHSEEPRLRAGIQAGTYYRREWLAGQIDRALGLDVVPATVIRDGTDGVGSAQDWQVGDLANRVVGFWDKLDAADAESICVLDALIQNTDRHSGNFLVTPSRRGIAIDNGLGFSLGSDATYSALLANSPEFAVTGRTRRRLTRFLDDDNDDARRELRACFASAFEEDGDLLYEAFMKRVRRLQRGAAVIDVLYNIETNTL